MIIHCGSLVYQTPMSLDQNEAGINYLYEAVDGSMQPYTGEYVHEPYVLV